MAILAGTRPVPRLGLESAKSGTVHGRLRLLMARLTQQRRERR